MGAGNRQFCEAEGKREARKAGPRIKAAKADRDGGREGEPFLAIPHRVLHSEGWRRVSPAARALLLDVAASAPNGALVATDRSLRPLGWRSAGTVSKLLKELIAARLLHLTRRGRLPNVAAHYAVTWHALKAPAAQMDEDLMRSFERSAYLRPELPERALSLSKRQALHRASKASAMSAKVRAAGYTPAPSHGALSQSYSSAARSAAVSIAPTHGAIGSDSSHSLTPCFGDFLDIAICQRQRGGRMFAILAQRLAARWPRSPGYMAARSLRPVPALAA